MRKAGWNRFLLFCLCICLGVVFAGCSDQKEQNNLDGIESQAVAEASDTASEGMEDKKANGEEADAQEKETFPENSAEVIEEESKPDNIMVYDYASMDEVLAAVVAVMKDEEINRFYREQSNDEMAANYLYSYVNLFDRDTFKTVEMKGKTYSTYVQPDEAYLQKLLRYAFGDAITLENLKSDDNLLLKKGDTFYVALGDRKPVLVDYVGVENEGFTEFTVYSFDYEVGLDGGDTEDGIVQVKFQEAPETESGIILKAVAIATY